MFNYCSRLLILLDAGYQDETASGTPDQLALGKAAVAKGHIRAPSSSGSGWRRWRWLQYAPSLAAAAALHFGDAFIRPPDRCGWQTGE
jgi:hypothetical protein